MYTASLKYSTAKLSVTLSNLPIFEIFALLKSYKIGYKLPCDLTHITLGMLLYYLVKSKIQFFCSCGRKRKQMAFWVASNCVIHPQYFDIFGVQNSESFPILIANKVFHVTVPLLIYFCEPPNAITQKPALFRAIHVLSKKITMPSYA